MGFFDDDWIEDVFREFLGEPSLGRRIRREKFIKGEDEERKIDYIEDNGKVYLIFELPGFSNKDVFIVTKGNELEISAKKENVEGVQEYLKNKLSNGKIIRKKLPEIVNAKKFKHTFKNGILEIIFDKRRS